MTDLIFAIRTKSNIKDPESAIKTSETLKLNKLNSVLVCPFDARVLGKLRRLKKVEYFLIDAQRDKVQIERLKKYLADKFKISEITRNIYFSVNSPYKGRVPLKERSFGRYLDAYLYRKKQKKPTISQI